MHMHLRMSMYTYNNGVPLHACEFRSVRLSSITSTHADSLVAAAWRNSHTRALLEISNTWIKHVIFLVVLVVTSAELLPGSST